MTVRVAVVGCGWWSTTAHLPALRADGRAQISALVDTDSERLRAAAAAFDVESTFDSVTAMLDAASPDAVVVAVPHAQHHPLAKLVLERGVHVLLEKPMTIEPGDAEELVGLARASGAELLIDYPWHYNSQALTLRRELQEDAIGAIEHVACLYASVVRELYRGNPERYRDVLGYTVSAPAQGTYSDPALAGGGQGQTQVTHAAALLLWLTGLRPVSVAAFTADFELAVDLVDGLLIRFEGGAVASLSSTGSMPADREEILRYDLFGRTGHAAFDVNQGTAVLATASGERRLPDLPANERYPMDAPVRNLVGVAAGTETNGSPGEIGRDTVVLVDAMYRAAAEQRVIELEGHA